MRATSIIISLLLFGSLNGIALGFNQSTPFFSKKELNQSKIKIFTKDGLKITGYLINADSEYLYIIENKEEAVKISSRNSGLKIPLNDIKELRYPKNKLGRILLGLLAGALSFLFLIAGALSNLGCHSSCDNGKVLFIFSALLFFGFLGLTASSLTPAQKTKGSLKATLTLNEIRSKSLWRTHLQKKYHVLSSIEQYIKLTEEGYINQYEVVKIRRTTKPSIKGFIAAYDDNYFYINTLKKNILHTVIDNTQAKYTISRSDIAAIDF